MTQSNQSWLKWVASNWLKSTQSDWNRLKLTEVDWNRFTVTETDSNWLKSTEQTFENLFSKVSSDNFSQFESVSVAYKCFQKTDFQSTPVEKIKASCIQNPSHFHTCESPEMLSLRAGDRGSSKDWQKNKSFKSWFAKKKSGTSLL